ncbi:MAG: hypothetical protein IJV38_11390 [Prevotella sp.]|nr:hypothetical protein [Prevotella sp.]
MKRLLALGVLVAVAMTAVAQQVYIVTSKKASEREQYAKEYLAGKLTALGCEVTARKGLAITLVNTGSGTAEGYSITKSKRGLTVAGNDASGVIYGCVELAERVKTAGGLTAFVAAAQQPIKDEPQMVMRGTCIGLQKTVYLPGHGVYEYPYTPENFPWFYDKAEWVKYLDMMVENKYNSLYLWNGHPFASLVKLADYPFALEVDEATFQKNVDMFSFLTHEADKRGIWVIQMFYNIILSKPFADHYGLKTQDRHRPITPLISDYTRKSIAAFIKNYPNVGLLVCLGEAMATIDDDVKWMKETIIPGILDGLNENEDENEDEDENENEDENFKTQHSTFNTQHSTLKTFPPLVLRSHDTDGPLVLKESLPLYPNIYTMSKYTGESLTTYTPGGPWGETHRQLAEAAPVHIDNVHILANLEPWRWSSPAFVQKTVQAMHRVHHSKGLHLYPQASYWDWPYTADKLADGSRLKQLDRDWMWYRAWGRYAWADQRGDDRSYWKRQIADYYGIDTTAAARILTAYDESGEIAPKLLRRFGITEGNRQTLLLGMKIAQLVNPYKYTIYPGFYESCGPEGEKLIEYVEKEWKHQPHKGELPLDIVDQCVLHGQTAYDALTLADIRPTRHADEYERLCADICCYYLFARSFRYKVLAAQQVLNYKWTKDIKWLDDAVPLLEESQRLWLTLAETTDKTYLYANSMQTAQRRIPVGGDGGKMKTWSELATVYQEELDALKANIERLKHPAVTKATDIVAATPAQVRLLSTLSSASGRSQGENPQNSTLNTQHSTLKKGAVLFENRPDTPVDSVAPELRNLQALVLNRDTTRIVGTTIAFESAEPVKMLVGFFQDDDPKWAKAPKLETDATGNEYGQAEPVLTNAVSIVQMPKVNIHQYALPAGRHTLRLPKGIIMVAGFTTTNIKPRDCGLNGAGNEVDWLFQK